MTLVSGSSTITFAGDGVQNLFDFNFRIIREEDLSATITRSDGLDLSLTYGTDYKLVSVLASESGGRVQYPLTGDPLPDGYTITFYRNVAYAQDLELVDNDPFSAALLNEAFDRSVMRDQQLQEQIDRALVYSISVPSKDKLPAQEYLQRVEGARDNAIEVASQVQRDREQADASKLAAEAAYAAATHVKNECIAARDQAENYILDDLSFFRSRKPLLSGPSEAAEGTTLTVNIADHSSSTDSYSVKVFGFGTADVSGGQIRWKLGSIDRDSVYWIDVVRRSVGKIDSEPTRYSVLVRDIGVMNGATISFTDSSEGWNKEDEQGAITSPAYSATATNPSQISSGLMEIKQVSGRLSVEGGSSTTVLRLADGYVAAGDELVTDVGACSVVSVRDSPCFVSRVADVFEDGSCRSFFPFDSDVKDYGPNEAHITSTAVHATGIFGNGAIFSVPVTDDMNIPFSPDAVTFSWWTTFTRAQSYSFFQTSIGNIGLDSIHSNTSYYVHELDGGGYQTEFGNLSHLVDDGLFHHIVMAFSNSEVKLYVDGSAYYASAYSPLLSGGECKMTRTCTKAMNVIDELRIFDRPLTAEEVAKLYKGPRIHTATITPSLARIPSCVFKKSAVDLKLGAGIWGEPLGLETPLKIEADKSTQSVLKFTADDLFLEDSQLELAPDPSFKSDGTAGGWSGSWSSMADIADGELTFPSLWSGIKVLVPEKYQGPGKQLSCRIHIKQLTQGTINVETQSNLAPVDGRKILKTAGWHEFVLTMDGPVSCVTILCSQYECDAVIDYCSVKTMETLKDHIVLLDGAVELASDPVFASDGTSGGWSFKPDAEPAIISGGKVVFQQTGSGLMANIPNEHRGKGKLLNCSVNVRSMSSGTLRFATYSYELPHSDNFTDITKPGWHNVTLTMDGSAEYVDLYSVSDDCDAVVDYVSIKPMQRINAAAKHKTLLVDGQELEITHLGENIVAGQSEVSDLYGNVFPEAPYPTEHDGNPFNKPSTATTNSGFRSYSPGESYFGSQFEKPEKIVGIDIKAYDQFEAFGSSAVKIQKSDNGVTWTDVHTFSMSVDWKIYSPRWESIPASYWRVVGNGGTHGWIIPYARWVRMTPDRLIATATLAEPLGTAPTAQTTLAIPDRCYLKSAQQTAEIVNSELTIKSGPVVLEDDESLKTVAMAVAGPRGLRFKSGKIYISEKSL